MNEIDCLLPDPTTSMVLFSLIVFQKLVTFLKYGMVIPGLEAPQVFSGLWS